MKLGNTAAELPKTKVWRVSGGGRDQDNIWMYLGVGAAVSSVGCTRIFNSNGVLGKGTSRDCDLCQNVMLGRIANGKEIRFEEGDEKVRHQGCEEIAS
jgi:hypothetical protein